jgi:hypothetical protein
MQRLFRFFSSIRLTVVLLACSMLLVFWGTLAQVNLGIHEVQHRFFESFVLIIPLIALEELSWIGFPFPGGYTLGGLLLINLICAHFRYYQPSRKKVGIILIHGGFLLLIVSGFLTSALQQETHMWLEEGEATRFLESTQDNELVFINKSSPGHDTLISIPESLLKTGATFTHEALPFSVTVTHYYPNADIGLRSQNPTTQVNPATHGAGAKMDIVVMPKPISYKDDVPNTATAYVTLSSDEGVIGTWLLSNLMDERFPPQHVVIEGNTFEIALRFKRTYLPYSVELIDFTHDRYPGTQIPRNFSSQIKVIQDATQEVRPALISMNHPLRYEGLTFYQASFAKNDTASMLLVVRNPSWQLPYIAVLIMGLGLVVHFFIQLKHFLKNR